MQIRQLCQTVAMITPVQTITKSHLRSFDYSCTITPNWVVIIMFHAIFITVWCHYSMVILFSKSSQQASHSLPMRASCRVSFVTKILIYISAQSLELCMEYHVIMNHVIMAPDCIMDHVMTVTNCSWLAYLAYLVQDCSNSIATTLELLQS